MSEEQPSSHFFELRTTCPMGDCPVTIHGEPHQDGLQIVDCSRWHEGHRCKAECAPQVSLEYAIELARKVQEMLEPPLFQRLEGISVASWLSVSQRVGGDFQCVHCLDGRVVAIQGDVMGKGINAALLAAYLVGMFEGLLLDGLPLNQILERMNRSVAQRTQARPMFATALVLEVDLKRRQWSFSRAGHELPMLVRQAGHRCRLVSGGCLPLGVEPEETYTVYRRPLHPGDRFLSYTDGIFEVGLKREQILAELMKPNATVESLVGLLPPSPPYRDDISLLLVACDTPL